MYSVLLIMGCLGLAMTITAFVVGPSQTEKADILTQNKKLLKIMCVWFAVILMVGGCLIGNIVRQQNNLIANCTAIDIPSSDDILYYDTVKDEYFFMKNNNWSLSKIVSRDIVDYETGKIIAENNRAIKNAIKNIEEKIQQKPKNS